MIQMSILEEGKSEFKVFVLLNLMTLSKVPMTNSGSFTLTNSAYSKPLSAARL